MVHEYVVLALHTLFPNYGQTTISNLSRQDPPPSWVKTIPLQVLHQLACVAASYNNQELQAVTDVIIIAFFFLLWPGEYTGTKYDSSPFHLSYVTFSVGRTLFDTATDTDNELVATIFVILVFTTSKDGMRGEKIGHGATGDPPLCPKEVLWHLVSHLQQHGAPADTPLARFKTPRGCWTNVTPLWSWNTLRPWSKSSQEPIWASCIKMYLHGPFGQQAPWHSSVPAWILISSAPLDAGGGTKFWGISMCRLIQ